MGNYKEIHLQAYADGKKLNLLDFNDLISLKGLDYMTQIDGEIIICRHNIEEDKKIENIGIINYSETPTEAILHRKIEEIIDYINKEEK